MGAKVPTWEEEGFRGGMSDLMFRKRKPGAKQKTSRVEGEKTAHCRKEEGGRLCLKKGREALSSTPEKMFIFEGLGGGAKKRRAY